MMVMFLEEIWSRNLGHMFASPLGVADYIAACMGFTFVKSIVSIVPAVLVALFLFHFSLGSRPIGLIENQEVVDSLPFNKGGKDERTILAERQAMAEAGAATAGR
jgi:hypothetical protein